MDSIWLTLFFPILGAVTIGFLSRYIGKLGTAFVGCSSILAAFIATLVKLWHYDVPYDTIAWTWLRLGWRGPNGFLEIPFGAYVDGLTLTMLSVVTGVAFLIHVYAAEYMAEEKDYGRFFACLNLFVATMVCLVLANNFAMLLIGWGGVGFASYSLIGFYNHKPSAAAASRKAFVINTLGDVGLMLAIYMIAVRVDTLDYARVFAPGNLHLLEPDAVAITCCLLLAAYAKSAQLPLHTWLPDAMEGPTPVSALIHAATMVTAGVYLVVRCHNLFELAPEIQNCVAIAGAMTALVAALAGLFQTDLKRVLAYSTMSQLGYMFLATGVGAYSAAIFHLATHAFFKALLFLSAGAIIHAVHGEQDITKMGGLGKKLGVTHWVFLIGSLALAGLPPLAGFFSKEEILGATAGSGNMALFGVGILTAGLTAYYSTRTYCLVFRGEGDSDTLSHLHLPGGFLKLPLIALGMLTVLAGAAGHSVHGLVHIAETQHPENHGLMALAVGVALAGIGIGYSLHATGKDVSLNPEQRQLFTGCFGMDEIQRKVLIENFHKLSRWFANKVDSIVSLRLPEMMSQATGLTSRFMADMQSGYLRVYALSMVIFILFMLLAFFYQIHQAYGGAQ